MATVIRIIKYEGDEEAVRAVIAKSMPLGIRDCNSYTITISEHRNDLGPVDTLPNDRIEQVLSLAEPWGEEEYSNHIGPFEQHLINMGKLT